MSKNLERLYVAMALPYQAGTHKIDEKALRKLVRYFLQPKFVDAGGAIIANPEAGEIFYLSREEKRRVIEITMEETNGKVPIFAGVIALTTEQCLVEARDVKELGADGLFIIPPMGAIDVTTSWNAERYPEVWIDMAKEIIGAVDMPAIAHPVASFNPQTGIGLPLSATLKMCTEIPQIIGWKMTYNYDGYRLITRGLRDLPRRVAILGASAVYFHENLAADAFDGTVSGSFNYAMEPMIDHIEAWRRGDVVEARQIWDSGLARLHEYVYSEFSRLHVRYKVAAWLRGLLPEPFMRPPLPRPRIAEVRTLHELLLAAGLPTIERGEIERVVALLPAERG